MPHITGVCELNTSEFPDALAFATKDALRIGSVDEIQRLHIKSVHLGEMARRVAHHRPARAYVLLSAKYEANETSGEETEVCSVKLLDDTDFSVLDSFKLDAYECAESVTTVSYTHLDVYKRQLVVCTWRAKQRQSTKSFAWSSWSSSRRSRPSWSSPRWCAC